MESNAMRMSCYHTQYKQISQIYCPKNARKNKHAVPLCYTKFENTKKLTSSN